MGRRYLAVDMDGLMTAFDTHLMEARHYLDLETGDILYVTDEAGRLASELVQDIPQGQEVTREALEAILAERDEQDWMLEDAVVAALVFQGEGERFIEVPAVESREGYHDMEDFVATVTDPQLRRALETAIGGRGAFRRFKDVLLGHPAERQRWFAFQNDIMGRRVLDWLDGLGIDPLPRADRRTVG